MYSIVAARGCHAQDLGLMVILVVCFSFFSLQAVLCGGLYPNVAKAESLPNGSVTFMTTSGPVYMHPTSTNHKKGALQPGAGGGGKVQYLVYLERVQTSRVYLRDSTYVSPLAFLMFGGDIAIRHEEGEVTVDGWIHFRAPARSAVLLKEARRTWEALLVAKIENPSQSFRTMRGGGLVAAIAKMAEAEGARS